jgi:putative iron-only hydrogenase system regulator
MKKIAVIGAVLDHPEACQKKFNELLSQYKHIIRGRMGIPFEASDISVVSITVMGSLDEINTLTGKLGSIPGINVKTSITKKEISE